MVLVPNAHAHIYDLSACVQSNTEQWGVHFALNSAAVLCCWVTTHLYEEQVSIGETAVTHCLL